MQDVIVIVLVVVVVMTEPLVVTVMGHTVVVV